MDKTKLVYFLPIIAGICWGSVGVFVRFLNAGGLDNYTIVCTRMIVSTIILGLFLLITNRENFKIPKKAIVVLIIGAVVGSSYMNVVYNVAILHLHLALSSVLIGLFALWALFLGRIFFGEKITRRKVICIIVALVGVVLVTGALEKTDFGTLSLYGLFMGIMCGIMYAVNGVTTRVLSDWGLKSTTINFWYFLIGAISLLPLCNWGQVTAYVSADPLTAIAWLIGQSLVCMILPYLVFTVALSKMEIALAGTLELVEPAAALMWGLVLFGEVPTPLMVVGVVVVIVALAMTMRTPNAKSSSGPGGDGQPLPPEQETALSEG